MSNRLKKSQGLYLQQHAENPVDWWPWCDEAFKIAQTKNKPVLISIGYGSCHWCHVMAHECFEDPFIAELMNRHFICIKIDREERPDLDQIYMETAQMITKNVGWPLNMFCLPDGRPFFGGTYFPPEDRGHGIIPWPQLIMRIVDKFKKNPEELFENADNILKNLALLNNPFPADANDICNEKIITAAHSIIKFHDNDFGGFGSAPKFPPSMMLEFLLEVKNLEDCKQDTQLSQNIDNCVLTTLKAIAHGGLYDQLGSGFMRYCVDRFWSIPHFEKMLYDNAQFIRIFTHAYLRYQEPLFKTIVEETIRWIQFEMHTPNGFAASIDADSEGEEGAYYVWTPKEIEAVLGTSDAKLFCDAYNINAKGNFHKSRTHLALVYNDLEKREALKPLREKLLTARNQRPAPTRDTKCILSWNALTIKALAEAGYYLENKKWFQNAVDLAESFWKKYVINNQLIGTKEQPNNFLSDYSYLIEAYLTLCAYGDSHHTGLSKTYLQRAEALTQTVLKHFKDNDGPGSYFTSDNDPPIITRKKEWWDNALPSSNSSMIHVLNELYAITGNSKYDKILNALKKPYGAWSSTMASSIAYGLSGFTSAASGITLLKVNNRSSLETIQKYLCKNPFKKIFIWENPSSTKNFELCINGICHPIEKNINQALELL